MVDLSNKKIAIIGSGKMGEIITYRLLKDNIIPAKGITCTDHDVKRLSFFSKEFGVNTTTNNSEAVASSDIIILCIKPQNTQFVLDKCRDSFTEDKICVSIMAGTTTAILEEFLPAETPVIRTMPNTCGRIGKGFTVLTKGSAANEEHLHHVTAIFEALGETEFLDEKHFDAVTALSASGPAFVYLFIESLADGGLKCGLPRDVAIRMASQLCQGAAAMVSETGQHPALLKDEVTTPAGCTIDGLLEMEAGGLRVTIIKAVAEAARRAGELAHSK